MLVHASMVSIMKKKIEQFPVSEKYTEEEDANSSRGRMSSESVIGRCQSLLCTVPYYLLFLNINVKKARQVLSSVCFKRRLALSTRGRVSFENVIEK
ncbi:hypothetical protein JTE90_000244 [Oedothorax gibbosus]|uniref:Uncharacterized protein n=1 Tax=Oedothorax gibbosus TaxID=931172 RepID=A0AAV6VB79_9ARAC|nr:hypothetical protein JTE90_000244 [Oedothorax gibbosus]